MKTLAVVFERFLGMCCLFVFIIFAYVGISIFGVMLLVGFRQHYPGEPVGIPIALLTALAACTILSVAALFFLLTRRTFRIADEIAAGRLPAGAVFKPSSASSLLGGLGFVALIVLWAMALSQKAVVYERARLSEAQTMASQIRRSQERYLARNGSYAATASDFQNLDIAFAGSPPTFGMRNFSLAVSASDCGSGTPGYRLVFTRSTSQVAMARRYRPGYSMTYDRCSNAYSYGDCAQCAKDFSDSKPEPPAIAAPSGRPITALSDIAKEADAGRRR